MTEIDPEKLKEGLIFLAEDNKGNITEFEILKISASGKYVNLLINSYRGLYDTWYHMRQLKFRGKIEYLN